MSHVLSKKLRSRDVFFDLVMWDVIIIGGGLSGLYAVDQLLKKNPKLRIHLIEATDRLGGRLRTKDQHDFGATWSWPYNDVLLTQLAQDLNIQMTTDSSEQRLVSPMEVSQVRFLGGTEQFVTKLAKKWSNKFELTLNQHVYSINYKNDGLVSVSTNNSTFTCNHVIMAVPPRMILKKIQFVPPLPMKKSQAMLQTPTWMAGASKIFFEFSEPFWRKGHRGMSFPPEWMVYDASFDLEKRFVICFFHAGKAKKVKPGDINLERMFGPEVKTYLVKSMHYNWLEDPWTCAQPEELQTRAGSSMQDMRLIGQNAALRDSVQNRIHFASTETQAEAGHMEGALQSAVRVSQDIICSYKE